MNKTTCRSLCIFLFVSISLVNLRGQQCQPSLSKDQAKGVTTVTFAVGKVITITASETITKKPKVYGLYTDPVKLKTNKKAPLKVLDKISASNPLDKFKAEWKKNIRLYDKKALKGKVISTALKEDSSLVSDLKLDKLVVQGWEDFSGFEFYFMKPEITGISGTLAADESFTVTGKYFGTKAPKILVEYNDKKGKIKYKKCKVDKKTLTYTDYKGKPSAMDWDSGDSEVTAIYPKLKDDDVPTGYIILDNKVGLATYDGGGGGGGGTGSISLKMAVSPDDSGTTTPETGTSYVTEGEARTITATAADGYTFVNWTATENATIADADSDITTVTLTNSATVTANFEETSPVSFAGIQVCYASGTDQVTLDWSEAKSSESATATFTYYVYQGTEDDVSTVYQKSNLVEKVTDSTEYTVSGLTAGTDYYFLVVAESNGGDKNQEHQLSSATTMTSDIAIDTQPVDIDTETTGDVTVSADEKTVTIGSDVTASIKEGSIIVLPESDELESTLKKVSAVSYAGGVSTLTVEDGSLGEVLESGELSCSTILPDPDDLPSQSPEALRARMARADMATKRLLQECEQLVAEGRNAYLDPEGRFLVVKEEKQDTIELTTGVSFKPILQFKPRLSTYAQWKKRDWAPDRLEMAAIIFGGDLKVGGELKLTASASTKEPYSTGKKYLWDKPRSKKFRYLVGGVPVYQEVMLNFVCEADFQPKAELEFSSTMAMRKKVKCAIRWTRDIGWNTNKTEGFEHQVTYSVKVRGGAVFNFKIYPEVSTRFYRTLTGTLSVKPKLTLSAEYEYDAQDIILNQFSKFDVGIGADVQMGAKFGVFSKTYVEKETDDLEILSPRNFFTLPSLEFDDPPLSGEIDDVLPLKVVIKDVTLNKFDQSSASWTVAPSDNTTLKIGSITTVKSGEYNDTATFSASAENKYNIYYSAMGDGFLGEMGRRTVKASINIGTELDITKCDSIDISIWGSKVPIKYEWTQREETEIKTSYNYGISYNSAGYYDGERFERNKVGWSGNSFSYSYNGDALPGQSDDVITGSGVGTGDVKFEISMSGTVNADNKLSGTFSLKSDEYSPDFSATEYDTCQANFTISGVPLDNTELVDVGGGTGDMLMVFRFYIYSSAAPSQISISKAVWGDVTPWDNGSGKLMSTDWSKATGEPVGMIHFKYFYKK